MTHFDLRIFFKWVGEKPPTIVKEFSTGTHRIEHHFQVGCAPTRAVLISNWRVISFYSQVARCRMPRTKYSQRWSRYSKKSRHLLLEVGTASCNSLKMLGLERAPWFWFEMRQDVHGLILHRHHQASAPSPLRLLLRGAPASVLLPEEPEFLKIRLKGLRLLGAFNFKNVLKWRNIQLWGGYCYPDVLWWTSFYESF